MGGTVADGPVRHFRRPGPRRRKREARSVHKKAEFAQKVHGLRAKLYNKQRHAEKIQMKKTCVAADLLAVCWRC